MRKYLRMGEYKIGKNKKILVIILFTTLSCSAFSQEVIRDTLFLRDYRYTSYRVKLSVRSDVTHLTVRGLILPTYFKYICEELPNLTYLDLSQSKAVDWIIHNKNDYEIIENQIPKEVFRFKQKLEKVILPDSLISVGDYAFAYTGIDSITIPSMVKHIGMSSFYACNKLKYISLPDSLQLIGYSAFENCINLPVIKIPEKTKVIVGDAAFSGCLSLKEILNSNNIVSIYSRAFRNCKNLNSFIISNNLSEIKEEVFYGCKSLSDIIIPDNIKSIESLAFGSCSQLKTINIPKRLTNIDFFDNKNHSCYDIYNISPFMGCSSLVSFSVAKTNPVFSAIDGVLYNKNKTVLICFPEGIKGEFTIPESVREIASFAFCNSNLSSIIIGKNVKKIGIGAFCGSKLLTSIELPAKLKKIREMTFYGCTELKTIKLPEGIKKIEELAFAGCAALISIELPNNIKEIGNQVFANCTALTAINLPNNLETIGNLTFENCKALKSLKLPQGLKYFYKIRDNESYNNPYGLISTCPDLSISIDERNPFFSIKDGVLFNKDSTKLLGCLTDIKGIYKIPASVKVIMFDAFLNMDNLTSVSMSNVDSIKNNAFANCSSLTSVSINNNMRYIGNNAFENCKALTDINLPDNLKTMEEYVFKNCTALTSLKLPKGLKQFSRKATYYGYYNIYFPDLSSISIDELNPFFTIKDGILFNKECTELLGCLTNIKGVYEIPFSVKIISNGAFGDMKNLTSISMSNVDSIKKNAFTHCNSLKKISVDWQKSRIGFCL